MRYSTFGICPSSFLDVMVGCAASRVEVMGAIQTSDAIVFPLSSKANKNAKPLNRNPHLAND